MTKKEYKLMEKDYPKYNWILVSQVLFALIFWSAVINHLSV
jgi:hypothetical protein